jgi:hypothetical protein
LDGYEQVGYSNATVVKDYWTEPQTIFLPGQNGTIIPINIPAKHIFNQKEEINKKYVLRLGREIGAEIILQTFDNKFCEKELKTEKEISCEKWDDTKYFYGLSFFKKKKEKFIE